MIKVKALHKRFGTNEVLKGIDLEIRQGEVVVLIGPSGTGKSTLLRCINFLERPDRGEITVGEITVSAETAKKREILNLRKQSSMVFQNYNLFKNKTILENVMEAMVMVQKTEKSEARKEAMRLLGLVGLEEKADEYPSRLSGGQQQRAGIARAMSVKPKIMLFDEPTSALDPQLVGEVLEVIKSLARQHTTMLIVTHEMQFAREAADKIVFLSGGRILEQGTPKQLFEQPLREETRAFLNLT